MYYIIGPYGVIGADRELEGARLLACCFSQVDFGLNVWRLSGHGVQEYYQNGHQISSEVKEHGNPR